MFTVRYIRITVCCLVALSNTIFALTPGGLAEVQDLTRAIEAGTISEKELRQRAAKLKPSENDMKRSIFEKLTLTADQKGYSDIFNPALVNKTTKTPQTVQQPTGTVTGPSGTMPVYGETKEQQPAGAIIGTIGSNVVTQVPEPEITKGKFEDTLNQLIDKEEKFIQRLDTDMTLQQIDAAEQDIKKLIDDFANKKFGYKLNQQEKKLLDQHTKLYDQYKKLAREKRDQLAETEKAIAIAEATAVNTLKQKTDSLTKNVDSWMQQNAPTLGEKIINEQIDAAQGWIKVAEDLTPKYQEAKDVIAKLRKAIENLKEKAKKEKQAAAKVTGIPQPTTTASPRTGVTTQSQPTTTSNEKIIEAGIDRKRELIKYLENLNKKSSITSDEQKDAEQRMNIELKKSLDEIEGFGNLIEPEIIRMKDYDRHTTTIQSLLDALRAKTKATSQPVKTPISGNELGKLLDMFMDKKYTYDDLQTYHLGLKQKGFTGTFIDPEWYSSLAQSKKETEFDKLMNNLHTQLQTTQSSNDKLYKIILPTYYKAKMMLSIYRYGMGVNNLAALLQNVIPDQNNASISVAEYLKEFEQQVDSSKITSTPQPTTPSSMADKELQQFNKEVLALEKELIALTNRTFTTPEATQASKKWDILVEKAGKLKQHYNLGTNALYLEIDNKIQSLANTVMKEISKKLQPISASPKTGATTQTQHGNLDALVDEYAKKKLTEQEYETFITYRTQDYGHFSDSQLLQSVKMKLVDSPPTHIRDIMERYSASKEHEQHMTGTQSKQTTETYLKTFLKQPTNKINLRTEGDNRLDQKQYPYVVNIVKGMFENTIK